MKLIIDLPDKIYENIKKRGFVSSRYDLKIAVAVDNGKPLQEELEEIKAEMNDYTVATGVLSKAEYSIAQCAFEAMKSIAFTIIDNHINNLK